jgi:hypothetical protein
MGTWTLQVTVMVMDACSCECSNWGVGVPCNADSQYLLLHPGAPCPYSPSSKSSPSPASIIHLIGDLGFLSS